MLQARQTLRTGMPTRMVRAKLTVNHSTGVGVCGGASSNLLLMSPQKAAEPAS